MPKKHIIFLFLASMLVVSCSPQTSTDYKMSQYLNSIRGQPEKIHNFFKALPKGADLHTHVGGTEYAERFIHYGMEGGFCLDKDNGIYKGSTCHKDDKLKYLTEGSVRYNQLIDAWSMRNFKDNEGETADQHFFLTFKIDNILNDFYGDVLKDVVIDAANNNVSYLELQTTLYDDKISDISNKISWDNNMEILYRKLLNNDIFSVVNNILRITKTAEEKKISYYLVILQLLKMDVMLLLNGNMWQ